MKTNKPSTSPKSCNKVVRSPVTYNVGNNITYFGGKWLHEDFSCWQASFNANQVQENCICTNSEAMVFDGTVNPDPTGSQQSSPFSYARKIVNP